MTTVRIGEREVQSDGKTVVLQIANDSRDLFDPINYAPAIPGVVVALAGLLIAHLLTRSRERRKELGDLCTDLKGKADDAAQTSINAWAAAAGGERQAAIHATKRKIQLLGIAATTLAKRSRGFRTIDVTHEVADFRRAATADPFEDPNRPADDRQIGAIMASLSGLIAKVDDDFLAKYRS